MKKHSKEVIMKANILRVALEREISSYQQIVERVAQRKLEDEYLRRIPLTFCTRVTRSFITHTRHGVVKHVVSEPIDD